MGKKLVLDFDVEADFDMLGIVSPIKDYRLMFYLNKALKCNFRREQPFHFIRKSKELILSTYQFHDEINQISLYFVANKHNGQVLIPEYKQLDFIMILDGEVDDEYTQNILRAIRTVGHIRMALQLDTLQMKSYDDMAHQLEMYFSSILA